MLNWIMDRLFAPRRRALRDKLWRIVATDRVMRTHRLRKGKPAFAGWRYLWSARLKALNAAA